MFKFKGIFSGLSSTERVFDNTVFTSSLIVEVILLAIFFVSSQIGHTETTERMIYLGSQLLIPVIFLICTLFSKFFIERNVALKWIIIIYVNLLIALFAFNFHQEPIFIYAVGFILLFQLLLSFISIRFYSRDCPLLYLYILKFISLLLILVNIYLFNKNNGDYILGLNNDIFTKSVVAAAIILALTFINVDRGIAKITKRFIIALYFLAIPFFTLSVAVPYDHHHSSYFLGPILKLEEGGTMMVDTYSQYGVVLFYFLQASLNFLGLGPTLQGLSLLTSLFTVATYICFFSLALLIYKKSIVIPILITSTAIGLHTFFADGYPALFPSTGALRFGLAYIFAIVLILKGEKLQGLWGDVIAGIFLGIATVWSLDSFPNTVLIFLATFVPQFIKNLQQPVAILILAVARRLFLGIFSIALFWAFVYLGTYLRSHALPDFVPYLSFLQLYSDGFGLVLMPVIGFWWIYLMVYVFSIIWSVFKFFSNKDYEREPIAIFFISVVGVAVFSYYVGRSHYNNLFHVSLPLVFLLGFWMWKLTKSRSLLDRIPFFVFIFLVAYIGLSHTDIIQDKLAVTTYGVVKSSWPENPVTSILGDIHESQVNDDQIFLSYIPFIHKIDIKNVKIAAFLPYDRTTAIMSILQKGNFGSVGEPAQDALVWDKIKPAVYREIDKLSVGDIVLAHDSKCFYSADPIRRERFDQLLRTKSLELITKENNVGAWRVVDYPVQETNMSPANDIPPIIDSIIPAEFTKSPNPLDFIDITIKGSNFSPATTFHFDIGTFSLVIVDDKTARVKLPQMAIYRGGEYVGFLQDCKGKSNNFKFQVDL